MQKNGLLDLSTLFDHGEENIVLGGEDRNRENIMNATVAQQFGEAYLTLIAEGSTEEGARAIIVHRYHSELGKAFKRLFGEELPEAAAGEVTMTENLAFRTVHDLLPGNVIVGGQTFTTTDSALVGLTMTKEELRAKSATVNGQINDVFRNIVFVIPPSTEIVIDLLERDQSFADQFSTEVNFEEMMAQLEDGKYDSDDLATQYIRDLFAKGLNVR